MTPRIETPKLLTSTEVAAMFRVDRKTVLRWSESGYLHPLRTPGGHRRYFLSEVNALFNRQITRQEADNQS